MNDIVKSVVADLQAARIKARATLTEAEESLKSRVQVYVMSNLHPLLLGLAAGLAVPWAVHRL